MQELIQELIEEIKRLTEQLQDQNGQLQKQSEQLAALRKEIAEKDALIVALTKRIEELTHRKNSGNSSVPPSKDGYHKPAPRSLRAKSGKKPGGQEGHKGKGMRIDRKPDEVISHKPAVCEGCPYAATCKLRSCETRYEYDVEVKTKLIAHEAMGCDCCHMTGQAERGAFPAHITGTKQYGKGVSALAVTLLTLGMVSVDRTQKLMSSLGIPISKGKVQDALTTAARKVEKALDYIKQMILLKFVLHFDETGIQVNGELEWLHCACTDKWRYYSVQDKRGKEGIDAMGILPMANGVAVHDFLKPYHKYNNVLHAMCCAHLERELVYAEESGNQDWAGKLRKLLQTMCHRRAVLAAEGANAFPTEELDAYLRQYDELVEEGMAVHPEPEKVPGKRGRVGKGKFRCLLERFRDFKDDILRFARNWLVPFTNNTAERAIRWAKLKDKVSGCFRSKAGAGQFTAVLSFVSTAALHGLSSFDALLSIFSDTAFQTALSWRD